MPIEKDVASAASLEVMRDVMLDMGLSAETVDALMADDDDLDALCDAALSELAGLSKKVANSRR